MTEPDAVNHGAQPPDLRFGNAWRAFVRELRTLLTSITAPQRPRYLDQFLQLRNATLDAAESDIVVQGLQKAWDVLVAEQGKLPADLLLMELLAFPPAAEVARETAPSNDAGASHRGLLSAAKTILGSVKDVLGDLLGPLVKGVVTALGEVVELLGG